ncbi:MAG: FtsX-like permease family protein [Bacteroidota bacterium]
MLKHYLVVAVRSIKANTVSYAISVLGLSIAASICFVVVLFLQFQYNMDKGHEDYKDIFMIKSLLGSVDNVQPWGLSPAPLKEHLTGLTDIKDATRIVLKSGQVQSDKDIFNEQIFLADQNIIDFFTFDTSKKASFKGVQNILISQAISKKYFESDNPEGSDLKITINGKSAIFSVSGIFNDYGDEYSFKPSIIISLRALSLFQPSIDGDWKAFVSATFIKRKSYARTKDIEAQLQAFTTPQRNVNQQWPVKRYELEPLSTLSLHSSLIKSSISNSYGDGNGRIAMVTFASFILILASLNYVNIFIYIGSTRYKEVGIRKTFGCAQKSILLQFVLENFLVSLIACLVGLILAISFLLPQFESLFDIRMSLKLSEFYRYLLLLVTLSFVISAVSGLYPSIQLSILNPVNVLKGRFLKGGKTVVIKSLLLFQFIIAFVLVFISFCLFENYQYLTKRNWGYDPENILSVAFTGQNEHLHPFENSVRQLQEVSGTARTNHHIGISRKVIDVLCNGEIINDISQFDFGKQYFPLMGMSLIGGAMSTTKDKIMINEELAKEFGENALGKILRFDSTDHIVSGIVKDFHYSNFNAPIQPTILTINETANKYLLIKTTSDPNVLRSKIEKIWKEVNVDRPLMLVVQNQIFDPYFRFIEGHNKVMRFLAFIALVLSLAGLYGIIALNIASRTKEMGIRKVLGINKKTLFYVFSAPYNKILFVANILGSLLGAYLVTIIFSNFYVYHIELNVSFFLVTMLIVSLGVYLPLLWHFRKLSRIDPVKVLKE